MKTLKELEERASYCSTQILILLDNEEELNNWLLKFRIKYWEYQFNKVNNLINNYYETVKLLKKEKEFWSWGEWALPVIHGGWG